MKSVIVLALVVLLASVLGRELTADDVNELPNNDFDENGNRCVWDFIIVGAGASGCIVASRLANETKKYILLIEGGAPITGQRDIGGRDWVASQFVTDPNTGKQRLGPPLTRYDVVQLGDSIRSAADVLNTTWNATAIGFFYQNAKVVGGNQAANGAGWYPPHKKSLDGWGIPEYNSTNFYPYVEKVENASDTGYPGRNTKGPVNVEFASFTPREQSMFWDAAMAAGYQDGGDIGNGSMGVGLYMQQYTTLNGIRETTSIDYLARVVGKRPNLTFQKSATVTRVLFDKRNTAIGVEYVDDCGRTYLVFARYEVILTAGTQQTAKILFNSGIGPASILNAFNKPHRYVNNIIGQNISNHQRATVSYKAPCFLLPNFYYISPAFVQFARNGTGPLNKQTVTLSVKINPLSPLPELWITVATGGIYPNDPYANDILCNVYLNQFAYKDGAMNLTSSDPLAGIIFVPNPLQRQSDAEMVAKGMLICRNVMQYWNGTLTEYSPGTNYTTVEQLVSFVKTHAFTAGHSYSSVPMGLESSAPCDTKMKVRGVQSLRVVGPASVPGKPVSFGMQALAMALGEKGTDLIKAEYGL